MENRMEHPAYGISVTNPISVNDADIKASDVLRELADLFDEKDKAYGPTYRMIGRQLKILFPGGITLKTATDFNRFFLINQALVKLHRYCNRFETGHKDSNEDLVVYGAMLAETDRNNGIGNSTSLGDERG